ncbi:putative crotonobetaine/carnitine-CoA ligase [Armadillidium nasatum]|uniref:Long-chain-fatty-acid--CoA ligase n=1 Tax=Armadillidium nasatum TaxID=96803 RepID=A0A5N5SSB6_9CRUS|nr:putative crotonobetaine/carnitine-CoA ligase [Armadillidium nasatum]
MTFSFPIDFNSRLDFYILIISLLLHFKWVLRLLFQLSRLRKLFDWLLALVRYITLKWKIRQIKSRNVGLPSLFQDVYRKHPDKIAFHFEEDKWTFRDLENYSNKIANYFRSQGVKHGDCVALYMENRLEYIGIWLGLCKLGAVPALMNNNLRLKSLKHCIAIVNSISIITSQEGQVVSIVEIITTLLSTSIILQIEKNFSYLSFDIITSEHRFQANLIDSFLRSLIASLKGCKIPLTPSLVLFFLFPNVRCFLTAIASNIMIGFKESDILYCPLPLYHMAAGIQASCQALCAGVTVVLRSKFSASNYWKDCIKYKVTLYILDLSGV